MTNGALPQFRRDLKVFKGPFEDDGSPTYNIHDPISGKYYKLRWGEYLMFHHLRPGMTTETFLKELQTHCTLEITEEEIKTFINDAYHMQLLDVSYGSEEFIRKTDLAQKNYFSQLFAQALYIRIPLFNPDNFLTRTLPYLKFLGTKPAFVAYAVICLLGLMVVINHFEEYLGTFLYFYNFQGILFYVLGIFTVKVIHELAHAYTAKYYGVHVTKMGIILIVLWPALFTDVTDGWKLWRRGQRMAISMSGIASELVMAGVASIGWYLSPPGHLQSLFFVISSVTWISTIIGNLNPALRFDGYYLLSDFLAIDNLQARSFAVGRWKMHKWLFGYDAPPPEEGLSTKQTAIMVVYSWFTWLYRLVLYTAIALFVYHFFIKIVGITLFFSEIIYFIVLPIWYEITFLKEKKAYMLNKTNAVTYTILALIALYLILPLPHKVRFTAITIPGEYQVVYVPEDSYVEDVYIKRGSKVTKGELLVKLDSKDIDQQIVDSELQMQILDNQIATLSREDESLPYVSEKRAALMSYAEKLTGLKAKKATLNLIANIDGDVYYFDKQMRKDLPVSKNRLVAKIAPKEFSKVVGYIPENYFDYVKVGQPASFLDGSTYNSYKGKIVRVSRNRTLTLPFKQLSSTYGGNLPAIQDEEGNLNLVDSYFQIELDLDKPEKLNYGETGYIEIRGPWESKIVQLTKYLVSLFWRESGL